GSEARAASRFGSGPEKEMSEAARRERASEATNRPSPKLSGGTAAPASAKSASPARPPAPPRSSIAPVNRTDEPCGAPSRASTSSAGQRSKWPETRDGAPDSASGQNPSISATPPPFSARTPESRKAAPSE